MAIIKNMELVKMLRTKQEKNLKDFSFQEKLHQEKIDRLEKLESQGIVAARCFSK